MEKSTIKRKILSNLKNHPSLSKFTWQWMSKKSLKETKEEEAEKVKIPTSMEEKEKIKVDFLRRTEGRVLTKGDLQRLGQESNLSYIEILKLCQEQVNEGKGEWLSGLERNRMGWRCQRCGETKVEEWISIYGRAATCPSCASLGSLSSLNTLYRSLNNQNKATNENNGVSRNNTSRNNTISRDDVVIRNKFNEVNTSFAKSKIIFSPRWELTPAQKKAAEEILSFVKSEEPQGQVNSLFEKGFQHKKGFQKEILLWAACGAGKTEVCFPAAAWALNNNQKVLFAAPRQDVVWDIAPRLEGDFPNLSLGVHTGTSPQRFTPSQFVVATTHQILRFYQAFDLIFLDEMDAFPYYGNKALAWGIEKALKDTGKIVYLTATPSPESLQKVKRGKMQLLTLPARHHGHPIPVPQWKKFTGNPDPRQGNAEKVIKNLLPRIEELGKAGPILLFVPQISWVNPWVQLLQEFLPQRSIEGSFSSDPNRREKIENLRKGSFQLFVCTSILERGVTFPRAQVIVLGADHEIFDERSLVQMAGRVGRSRECPTGTALFLAPKTTPAIK
ncbi:MAG: DEAD/DEAH box helicase family protein [Desulfitobacterium sp.]|nr:DEAD/DEAH box helicase family protein [Desulfitobacterium sp.]